MGHVSLICWLSYAHFAWSFTAADKRGAVLARAKDLELMQVIALTKPLNRQAWCSIGSDQRSRRRRRHPGITLLFSKCLATH